MTYDDILDQFDYRPACDLWLPSIELPHGKRYFRHYANYWQRIEGSKVYRLTGDVLAIAEEMHTAGVDQ